MTSLTISSFSYSIADDGSGTYTLDSWQPGPRLRENRVSESEHLPGGDLNGSRELLTSMRLSVLVKDVDVDAAWAAAMVLETALGNGGDAFTITETFGLTDVEYSCLPATSIEIIRDPGPMRDGMFVVVATIPRQPSVTWTGP